MLEPAQNLAPHSFERVRACPPGASSPYSPCVCRPYLSLSPQIGQLRQEALKALPIGCAPWLDRADRCQCGLGLPYGMQQRHGVQVRSALPQPPLRLLSNIISTEQTVAGCGRLAVALRHAASIPALGQQLEGRLEVVHIQTHSTVEVGHRLACDRSRVALMSGVGSPSRSSVLSTPDRSCGTHASG